MRAMAIVTQFGLITRRSFFAGAALLLSGFLSLVMPGCGGAATNEKNEASKGVEKVLERGPLNLTLRTSAETISTAETLNLTLSATIEDGYSVAFPVYPEPAEPESSLHRQGTKTPRPSSPKTAKSPEAAPIGWSPFWKVATPSRLSPSHSGKKWRAKMKSPLRKQSR